MPGCEEQACLGLGEQVLQLKGARAQEDVFRGLLRARWRMTWRLLEQSSGPHLYFTFLYSKGCSCNAGSISTQSCLGLGNIRNQGAIKFDSSCTWYAYVGVFASFTACQGELIYLIAMPRSFSHLHCQNSHALLVEHHAYVLHCMEGWAETGRLGS